MSNPRWVPQVTLQYIKVEPKHEPFPRVLVRDDFHMMKPDDLRRFLGFPADLTLVFRRMTVPDTEGHAWRQYAVLVRENLDSTTVSDDDVRNRGRV